ncbi:hypothetical protein SHJG_5484 [Streptomyces hygroscopicus subsp. jinggangensis 5008]|nr:hypothetical protein SHJG_5484 [Streptomyces hygroscopicus subsp. jinggangensis 5008]AGF64910.1 hypothetical protein SHJGH_5247 [Streptomyces hygroscopicus subsp. jinggangensis TL01]
MSDAQVAEARRQAARGNVDHPLVQQMVCAFVDGFGLKPSGAKWSAGEAATLLDALGMLPVQWTGKHDAELYVFLSAAAAEQAGGGS